MLQDQESGDLLEELLDAYEVQKTPWRSLNLDKLAAECATVARQLGYLDLEQLCGVHARSIIDGDPFVACESHELRVIFK